MFEFIQENFLILVACLNVLGYSIKHTSLIKDEFIPIILLLVGSILGAILSTETSFTVFDGILQGLLCGGCAVGINEVPKQLMKLK